MTVQKLDEQLHQAAEDYKEEIKFLLDTFDQSHDDDKLTKQDLENMGRHTYYALSEFKKHIVNYLKESNR